MGTQTRRGFLLAAAAGAGSLASCSIFGGRSGPNARLRIAQIGCGGKGFSDMQAVGREHDVVALCDVDESLARNARSECPRAAFYFDYRDLFDREKLDAVVVSTPDHSHALPALIAMQLGYHVFVQKPLAHTIEEVRLLRDAARYYGVTTSMGNQGTCLDGFRQATEIVRSGAIGAVKEVHVWTNRPAGLWTQGIARPSHVDAIPASLRWDLWLGGAAHRPYAQARRDQFTGYAPFHWRGFWDFGTGALGDMACHIANLPFYALELSTPEWVEAEAEGRNDETAPLRSTIRFGFPPNGDRDHPVLMTWYDGGRMPPDQLLPDHSQRKGQRSPGDGGCLLVGDRGRLYSPSDYGDAWVLYPKERFLGFKPPEPSLPRSPGIHDEWLQCIQDGTEPTAGFEYAAQLTEAMLLGNVALRTGQRIEWDHEAMAATNCPDAERYLKKEYRRGFDLPRL